MSMTPTNQPTECPFCGGPAEEEEGYAYCPNDCGGLECTPATWNTRAADRKNNHDC